MISDWTYSYYRPTANTLVLFISCCFFLRTSETPTLSSSLPTKTRPNKKQKSISFETQRMLRKISSLMRMQGGNTMNEANAELDGGSQTMSQTLSQTASQSVSRSRGSGSTKSSKSVGRKKPKTIMKYEYEDNNDDGNDDESCFSLGSEDAMHEQTHGNEDPYWMLKQRGPITSEDYRTKRSSPKQPLMRRDEAEEYLLMQRQIGAIEATRKRNTLERQRKQRTLKAVSELDQLRTALQSYPKPDWGAVDRTIQQYGNGGFSNEVIAQMKDASELTAHELTRLTLEHVRLVRTIQSTSKSSSVYLRLLNRLDELEMKIAAARRTMDGFIAFADTIIAPTRALLRRTTLQR